MEWRQERFGSAMHEPVTNHMAPENVCGSCENLGVEYDLK